MTSELFLWSVVLFVCLFWGRVSCTPGWPPTYYVAGNHFEHPPFSPEMTGVCHHARCVLGSAGEWVLSSVRAGQALFYLSSHSSPQKNLFMKRLQQRELYCWVLQVSQPKLLTKSNFCSSVSSKHSNLWQRGIWQHFPQHSRVYMIDIPLDYRLLRWKAEATTDQHLKFNSATLLCSAQLQRNHVAMISFLPIWHSPHRQKQLASWHQWRALPHPMTGAPEEERPCQMCLVSMTNGSLLHRSRIVK